MVNYELERYGRKHLYPYLQFHPDISPVEPRTVMKFAIGIVGLGSRFEGETS
jgi:hypothetical protein